MKINERLAISCKSCLLIPYRRHHVPKYHDWMESVELRDLTASERLTLDEEYEMQRDWHLDDNKCTFIILQKPNKSLHELSNKEEIDNMIGDVNAFLSLGGDMLAAELEIMIAEPRARGHGIGKQSVVAMMCFCISQLKVEQFTAKIGYTNANSISLFKKLGFSEVGRSDVFQEVTLELKVTPSLDKELLKNLDDFSICDFPDK